MTIRGVNGWMRDHILLLALGKTEIVVLIKMAIETVTLMREGGSTPRPS